MNSRVPHYRIINIVTSLSHVEFSTKALDIAAVLFLLCSLLWLVPMGYIASDDGQYLVGARKFISYFESSGNDEAAPRPSSHHQELRLSLILPTAASIALFGESEFALVLPTTAYLFALVVLTYLAVADFLDRRTALISSALLATLPIFVTKGTIAGVDVPLVCFVVLSLWLYCRATRAPSPSLLLFGAGIAAGFGWLSHETIVALLVLYGVLFLLGLYLPRRAYFFIALGFGSLFAAEAAWHLFTSGDPLHRLVAISRPMIARLPQIAPIHGYPCELASNRTICSTLNLFLRADFGVLFYLAIPAGWIAWRSNSVSAEQRRFLRLLVAFAILWFVIVVHVVQLRPRPRYFMVAALAAIVLIAFWIGATTRRRLARAALATLFATHSVCLYLMERNPMFGERALVDFVASAEEPVYTDPRLADRAGPFLRWKGVGLGDRVHARPPPPGSLFFFYEVTVASGEVAGGARFDTFQFRRPNGSTVVWHRSRNSLLGDLERSPAFEASVPNFVMEKIQRRSVGATVYRLNGE